MRARLFLARLPEAAGKLLGGCKPVLSENLQSCTRQISTESLAPGSLRYTGSSDKTFSTLLSGATKQQLGHPGVSFAAQVRTTHLIAALVEPSGVSKPLAILRLDRGPDQPVQPCLLALGSW